MSVSTSERMAQQEEGIPKGFEWSRDRFLKQFYGRKVEISWSDPATFAAGSNVVGVFEYRLARTISERTEVLIRVGDFAYIHIPPEYVSHIEVLD